MRVVWIDRAAAPCRDRAGTMPRLAWPQFPTGSMQSPAKTLAPEPPTVKPSMVNVPTHRRPTHPGTMLATEFLGPGRTSVGELARSLGLPASRARHLLGGHHGVGEQIATGLACLTGTSRGYWLNMQLRWDLYWTGQRRGPTAARPPSAKASPTSLPGDGTGPG